MSGSQGARNAAKSAAGDAEAAGKRAEQTKTFGALVTVGLMAYGVVHLLIAWIALQIAWTGTGDKASQKGAFSQMRESPIGLVLLWVTAVGLFALAVWQVCEAAWGHRDREEGRKRTTKRVGSAGKAVVYVSLGISAVSTAAGSSSANSDSEKTLTARLLSVPFGRVLVIAVGITILVLGAKLFYRGVKKRFTRDLVGGVSRNVIRLGIVGYCAKGVAFAVVGILFGVAAITYDPNKAGGLDAALRTLGEQPFGTALLTATALGIACFGLYCFAWSRHAKKT